MKGYATPGPLRYVLSDDDKTNGSCMTVACVSRIVFDVGVPIGQIE